MAKLSCIVNAGEIILTSLQLAPIYKTAYTAYTAYTERIRK